jgi:hypothetical protein
MELQSRRNEEWALRWDNEQGLLIAEAGDDERFGLSDLDAHDADPLLKAWNDNAFDSLRTTAPSALAALEKLRVLGAITSGRPANATPQRVFAMAIGRAAQPAIDYLGSMTREQTLITTGSAFEAELDFDLAVVIRAGGSYKDLLAATESLAKIPHLFIDASFHHTISIGPLVVPGCSACLQCLTTRLTNRWNEAPPPPAPKVAQKPELLAALALDEILNWQQGSSLLVGRVRQIDTHTWHTATDTLLRTTPCPRCSESDTP